MSEDLIARLSAELRPTPRLALVRRLVLGVGVGGAVSAVLAGLTLGFRPDMGRAAAEAMFWVKLVYALALAGLSLWACERLARPAGVAGRRMGWLAAPVLAMVLLAVWQWVQAPGPMRMPMVMGHSARVCPWLILACSLPPLVGLIWAVRGLAPTRLRLTGVLLGVAAGGAGATAYALHCDEAAAPFLAVWYTLGILGAGVLGGLAGPRVLRW